MNGMYSSNPRTALKIICLLWLSLLVGCSKYDAGQAAFDQGDYQTAFSRWERLAQFGDARAQNKLGYLYERGLGVSKNTEVAFSWYQKSAESGLSSAQNNVGLCLLNGIGTAPNAAEARKWFELAVAQNNADAANNLGVLFNQGRAIRNRRKSGCSGCPKQPWATLPSG
jgi:TPR repeat protein